MSNFAWSEQANLETFLPIDVNEDNYYVIKIKPGYKMKGLVVCSLRRMFYNTVIRVNAGEYHLPYRAFDEFRTAAQREWDERSKVFKELGT